jgi:hypothetical protein
MKRLTMGAIVLAVMAGCGDSDEPADSPQPAGGANEPAERETEVERAERQAIKRAREECKLFAVKDLVETYGGDPDDLASVARAYAAEAYQPGLRVQAEVACLEGLRAK